MVGRSLLVRGETASNFTLKDQDNKKFRLSDLRGRRVFLSFYPVAWTDISAKQMKAMEENYDTFESMNTVPVGISINSISTNKAWLKQLKMEKVRVLSDFGPVAELYGLFREKDSFFERANIVLDEDGKVIFSKVYKLSELPDIQEVIKVLNEKE